MIMKATQIHGTLRTALAGLLAAGVFSTAEADVVIQYSFEGNLDDTAAAGTVADNLSYNQGVSVSSTPSYETGVGAGQAAVFDGNWFQAPDSVDSSLNDDTWTIELFVSVSAHNGQWERLVTKWGGSADYHFALETTDFNFFTGNPVGNVFDSNTAPTTDFTDGEVRSVYEASLNYKEAGTPLVVLAGSDYGMGSSRDWAAKGTFLLGVRAVIATSYERIHRSNLVMHGVLPLQFAAAEDADSLDLDGTEAIDVAVDDSLTPGEDIEVTATRADGTVVKFTTTARVDTPIEVDYLRHGGILHMVLRQMAEG